MIDLTCQSTNQITSLFLSSCLAELSTLLDDDFNLIDTSTADLLLDGFLSSLLDDF